MHTMNMYFQSSQQASQQLFTAASGIVENVASQVIVPTEVEQPNIDYIVRVVNRKRQRLRPEDPRDLDFEVIQYDIIRIKCYILAPSKRHVIKMLHPSLTVR